MEGGLDTAQEIFNLITFLFRFASLTCEAQSYLHAKVRMCFCSDVGSYVMHVMYYIIIILFF